MYSVSMKCLIACIKTFILTEFVICQACQKFLGSDTKIGPWFWCFGRTLLLMAINLYSITHFLADLEMLGLLNDKMRRMRYSKRGQSNPEPPVLLIGRVMEEKN